MCKSQDYPQFHLRDLLAINGPIPEGFSCVVLKSYFDGGNQADSGKYELVSLAAMSGTPDVWTPFEEDWNNILVSHHAHHLHTTDAVAREGIYTGWTEEQRDSFLSDCVHVAATHSARPTIGDIQGRYGLFYFVISFVLKDFISFAKEHPESPNNVNESCLRQSLSEVLPYSIEQAACDQCHLFFDQGEPFYGHLKQLKENKKAAKEATALSRITHYSESDMRCVPALQLADLYAWGQSHRQLKFKPAWLDFLLRTWFLWSWIDESNIHQVDSKSQAMWSSWKLPKRRATK